MRRDYSPEEKLLKLIKNAGRKDALRTSVGANSSGETQANKDSMINTKERAKGFHPEYIDTKRINSLLITILAALLVYFIYGIFANNHPRRDIDIMLVPEKKNGQAPKKQDLKEEPYSYYSSQIGGRNIFMPQEPQTGDAGSNVMLDEVSSNLSLIGIIAGDRPQAIIEDKKMGKSYFLYKGGSVGQAKVVDILENSVIMEFKGTKFELML